ncbi:MAG: hypothetical protein AB7I01_02275 [Gammaproteobacteria bacterium]
MSATAPAARRWWRRPAPLLALTLFVLDALLLGQGLVAALLLMLVGGLLLPKALLLFKLRRDGWAVLRLALLLTLTALAIMLTISGNNRLARSRAMAVVEAVDTYRGVHGRYPLSLDALVPRYLAAVPRAKYALAFDDFLYERAGDGARLGFVEVPPFGRPCYDFTLRRWQEIDWRRLSGAGGCPQARTQAPRNPAP